MCGIVGVVNDNTTLRIAVDALKRLEYRGYDSFGVATLYTNNIVIKKDVGSVIEKDEKGFFTDVPDAAVTIAHTRWATHGGVTQVNAHPHLSFDGNFALVHNGVIENYRELREELETQGIKCQSETDTEVIVQLLAKHYEQTPDILEALRLTVEKLRGEYAFTFITQHEPDYVYGVRYKSPLAFGCVDNMTIIASDQRAIAPLTQNITFLEDGDVIKASSRNAICYSLNGKTAAVQRAKTHLPWTSDGDGKDGYPHYMLKEVHEAPFAIENAHKIREVDLYPIVKDISERDLNITGAGSAFYVSQIGQYLFASLAKKYARVHPSDEFLSLLKPCERDHLIAVSQSGETFDTLEVIRAACRNAASVTSINNVFGSSCQRLATYPVFQGAGTEVCVLSTKSIVSQSFILYRLAKILGRETGVLNPETFDRLSDDAQKLPSFIETLFKEREEKIKETAVKNSRIDNWFFIGRGIYYPVAMESALKFKEVSYLHAEGMPAGFFKHGTISLIDENFYTIAFLPNKQLDPDTFRFTMSNISEIQARGGKVIAFGHEVETHPDVLHLYDYVKLPTLNAYLDPILHLIAGQLLAYYCAVSLGRNIDKPRALAKSVTVR